MDNWNPKIASSIVDAMQGQEVSVRCDPSPIYDWHAGKAAALYAREIRWRARRRAFKVYCFRALRAALIATAIGLVWAVCKGWVI